jgi:hypothetical protein
MSLVGELQSFKEIMREVLKELRAIRALLEDQQESRFVEIDDATWKIWRGDTGD